jgi:hypothetical protein
MRFLFLILFTTNILANCDKFQKFLNNYYALYDGHKKNPLTDIRKYPDRSWINQKYLIKEEGYHQSTWTEQYRSFGYTSSSISQIDLQLQVSKDPSKPDLSQYQQGQDYYSFQIQHQFQPLFEEYGDKEKEYKLGFNMATDSDCQPNTFIFNPLPEKIMVTGKEQKEAEELLLSDMGPFTLLAAYNSGQCLNNLNNSRQIRSTMDKGACYSLRDDMMKLQTKIELAQSDVENAEQYQRFKSYCKISEDSEENTCSPMQKELQSVCMEYQNKIKRRPCAYLVKNYSEILQDARRMAQSLMEAYGLCKTMSHQGLLGSSSTSSRGKKKKKARGY